MGQPQKIRHKRCSQKCRISEVYPYVIVFANSYGIYGVLLALHIEIIMGQT